MNKRSSVLLIHDPSSDAEPIRRLFAQEEGLTLQCLTRLPTALARIAGGGVDAIIVNLSPSEGIEAERLESFLKLQRAAPHLPIIVICDSPAESLLGLTKKVGAAASLSAEQCLTDLRPLLNRLIGTRDFNDARVWDSSPTGTIVTFLGSKGGVGTTTVALNVACSLSRHQRVILSELRPAPGTLSQYFRTPDALRDLTYLLDLKPEQVDVSDVEACLWPYRKMPGLSILFGPQRCNRYSPIGFEYAEIIAEKLRALTDCVVVDLPAMPSDANRAMIQASDCLAIVVERDPISLKSARLTLETIMGWGCVPQTIGSVIVNRAPVAAPIEIEEFETRLGIPIFEVIPPAGEDCVAALRANRPLVSFDSDSMIGHNLAALAETLAKCARPPQFERKLA
jgi:pilus assembly protein CpaE